MQVILLERVAKLGQMGDVVNVKPGYARNYLLPQGKALRASNDNIKSFEVRKAELEAQNLETRKEAQAVAARLEGETYVVIRQASDGGALYGSVSPRDVADLLAEAGVKIERRQIVITTPIKVLGLHTALINLHPEVEVEIGLNVARSAEEAELQASGKSIQELAAEEEAAAEFEISELFDDIGAAGMDEDDQRGSDEQRES
jgi:large subunit ribosomal protein L9